jgi:hypothetical protein
VFLTIGDYPYSPIAALTCAGGRAGKRSLHVRPPVSGQAPCSGARRRGKALDEVSAAIPGDAVAGNELFNSFCISMHLEKYLD